jgi:hypothetical protein
MKPCPNCRKMMEEVDVSGLPEQPADDSKIPGVPRVRFRCASCHHLEEGYIKGATCSTLDPPQASCESQPRGPILQTVILRSNGKSRYTFSIETTRGSDRTKAALRSEMSGPAYELVTTVTTQPATPAKNKTSKPRMIPISMQVSMNEQDYTRRQTPVQICCILLSITGHACWWISPNMVG